MKPSQKQGEPKQTEWPTPQLGEPKNQSACEVKKQNERQSGNVTCGTTVRKCRSVLQENALKQEQLPKTCVTKGVEMGPNQLVKKLCGITLQAVALVRGGSDGQLMNWSKGKSMNWTMGQSANHAVGQSMNWAAEKLVNQAQLI